MAVWILVLHFPWLTGSSLPQLVSGKFQQITVILVDYGGFCRIVDSAFWSDPLYDLPFDNIQHMVLQVDRMVINVLVGQ